MRPNVYSVSSLAALAALVWACDNAPMQPNTRAALEGNDAALVSYTSAGTMVTAPPVSESILRAIEADPVPDDPAQFHEDADLFLLDGRLPGLSNEWRVSHDALATPPPTCTDCEHHQGTMTAPGDADLQPAGAFYFHSAGTHRAWLDGPSEANFDLYLFKFDFVSRSWKLRAYSVGGAADEEVVHTGGAGYYTWLVYGRTGAGPYDFWLQTTGDPFDTVPPETLVGAGDIAECAVLHNAEATAQLLDQIPGTVFTVGDNAYHFGSLPEYMACYEPTWGRHLDRTYPTPGNHDYNTPGAAGYFAYFGDRAGTPGEGWYSYDLGAWHIIALNSNLPLDAGSPQLQWLQADLAASTSTCTLAYWHDPRFSSGAHGNANILEDVWNVLYEAGAEIVISAHDHIYERFAPQRPDEVADPAGIREFLAGTGGGTLGAVFTVRPNSEVRWSMYYHGVLKFTLYESIYDWEFIPLVGQPLLDAGSGACH